ncbi:MAG TPA: hypothetical protein VF461_12695, partial [Gemmatimonadaceae bacterium]
MHIRSHRFALAAVGAAALIVPSVARAQFEAPPPPREVHRIAGLDVGVHGDLNGFTLDWTTH